MMKKNKKRKKGRFLIFIGLIMIALSVLLTVNNFYDDLRAGESAKKIIAGLNITRKTVNIASDDTSAIYNNRTDIPDYKLASDMQMPAITVNDSRYVGILTIPSLGLELPVLEEYNYDDLVYSPCRYSGSIYKDNMVIAAHNYQAHFGTLQKLTNGDKVTFTDADGNVFPFKVAYVGKLKAEDVDKMIESEYPLTLFTCNYSGSERVTVRCEKPGK